MPSFRLDEDHFVWNSVRVPGHVHAKEMIGWVESAPATNSFNDISYCRLVVHLYAYVLEEKSNLKVCCSSNQKFATFKKRKVFHVFQHSMHKLREVFSKDNLFCGRKLLKPT